MNRPQNSYRNLLRPNVHQGPKKTKITPKLSQIQMSEFRESQKMKVVQVNEWTPKQFLNPTLNPKIAHQGPKKSRTNQKSSQNQTSEWKEAKKIKVVALYEQTPKQFEPDPNPQNSLLFCPKKAKKITLKLDEIKSKN